MKVAVYPGSFDPITYGHMDIVKRALKVFDRLIILISVNPSKSSLFTGEERVDMVKEVLKPCIDKIDVLTSNELSVKETKRLGATHMIRGLRAMTDFEYEFQLTHTNRVLEQDVDSVFFMTSNKYSFLSSTTVKEIALFKGELGPFVPEYVEEKIKEKLNY
jgi:pantetheine-phosphate adenylyltransferase